MRRLVLVTLALALATTGCLAGGGSKERTVLVDYSSDRFGSFFLYNFPKKIVVRPGTTLVFRQTWTGEPHTVTGGTAVAGVVRTTNKLLDSFVTFDYLRANGLDFPDPESEAAAKISFADFVKALKRAQPQDRREHFIKTWNDLRNEGMKLPDLEKPGTLTFGDVNKVLEEEANKAFEALPSAFDEGTGINQNVGQPCYLRSGLPPKDKAKPCAKNEQVQPAFDGKNSFYSSGIIRYEGARGNTFRIPLSKNIRPGKYTFYCAVHGPLQSTEVEVRGADARVPSQDEISREARKEIDGVAKSLDEVWTDAADGRIISPAGDKSILTGPFAGLFTPKEDHAAIDAFVPSKLTVKAGAPITWKMMGSDHTISFDVPTYFPPVEFMKDGTVRFNPKLEPPAGGAPKPPEQQGRGVRKIDGGTYDGNGFWSSGLISSEPYLEYTLRISKPGTYRFACLLHPPMVGTVVVTP
jgi:plastocyanin